MSIIFQDYFETYPLGPVVPTGFDVAGAIASNIVQDTSPIVNPFSPPLIGIDGTKGWQLFGQGRRFITPVSSISHFIAFWAFPGQTQRIILVGNGNPANLLVGIDLVKVAEESDGSLSFRDVDDVLYKNSGTEGFYLAPFSWYTMQLNLTFSKVTVLGTDVLAIRMECSIQGLNPEPGDGGFYFQQSHTTNTPIAGLFTATPEMNRFFYNLAGYLVDSITVEDQVPINSYPVPGVPNVRDSQDVFEIMKLPDDSNVRVSSDVIEIGKLPDNSSIRIISDIIELAVANFKRKNTGWIVKES